MPPVHDSAVARVSPRVRQRSSTISAIVRSFSLKKCLPRRARMNSTTRVRAPLPGLDEEIDVDLELASADRHLDAVAVAACVRERLRDGRLRRSEEAKHPVLARRRTLEHSLHGLGLEGARPEAPKLGRRAGKHDDDASVRVEDDSGCGSCEAERESALGEGCLLANACREVCVRTSEPIRDHARDGPDLRSSTSSTASAVPRRVRRARWCDRRASGRARPRRGTDRRRTPRGRRARDPRRVADDGDPRRLEAEANGLSGEERAVAVLALAPDELAAGHDDGRAWARSRGRTRDPSRGDDERRPPGRLIRLPLTRDRDVLRLGERELQALAFERLPLPPLERAAVQELSGSRSRADFHPRAARRSLESRAAALVQREGFGVVARRATRVREPSRLRGRRISRPQ